MGFLFPQKCTQEFFFNWKSRRKHWKGLRRMLKGRRRRIPMTICDFRCMMSVIKRSQSVPAWDESSNNNIPMWVEIIHLQLDPSTSLHILVSLTRQFQLIFYKKSHCLKHTWMWNANEIRVKFHPSSHQFKFKLKSTKLIQSSRVEISFRNFYSSHIANCLPFVLQFPFT